jgi:hypothetical protein
VEERGFARLKLLWHDLQDLASRTALNQNTEVALVVFDAFNNLANPTSRTDLELRGLQHYDEALCAPRCHCPAVHLSITRLEELQLVAGSSREVPGPSAEKG